MYKKFRDITHKEAAWSECPICGCDLTNSPSRTLLGLTTVECQNCQSITTWDFYVEPPVCLTVAEQLAIL